MSAYQIGQLVGTLLGGIAGAFITYKLMKSSSKVARVAALPVALIMLAYVGLSAHKVMGAATVEFKAGFINGCVRKCTLNPQLAAICQSTCECQYGKLVASEGPEAIMKRLQHVKSEADIDPATAEQLRSATAACVTPTLYDQTFMASCGAECRDAGCPEHCSCVLGKLREGMDAESGTRWLVDNVERAPATPAGEAKLQGAIQACSAGAATP